LANRHIDLKAPIAHAASKIAIGAAEIPAKLFTSETLKDFVGWSSRPNLSASEEIRLHRLWHIAQTRESQFRTDDIDWSKYKVKRSAQIFTKDEVRLLHEAANCVVGQEPSGNIRCMSSLPDSLYKRFLMLYESAEPIHVAYEFDLGPTRLFHHGMYLGTKDENGLIIEVANINYKGSVTGFIAPSTLLNFIARCASNKSGLYAFQYTQTIPLKLATERAVSALGKFKYNAASSNCENFSSWVMTNNDTNQFCKHVVQKISDQMKGGSRQRL
jgi:hypothetical protein